MEVVGEHRPLVSPKVSVPRPSLHIPQRQEGAWCAMTHLVPPAEVRAQLEAEGGGGGESKDCWGGEEAGR